MPLNGGLHPVTVGPSESRTYRAMPIAATKRSACKATQQQSCLCNSDFDGSMPGLQVPNLEGIAVSKAVEIRSYNMSKNIEPAAYCLFVRGVNADTPCLSRWGCLLTDLRGKVALQPP